MRDPVQGRALNTQDNTNASLPESPWKSTTPLPQARSELGSAFAPLQSQGGPGAWTAQTRISPGRWGHRSVVQGENVYLLEGITGTETDPAVPHVQSGRFRTLGGFQ